MAKTILAALGLILLTLVVWVLASLVPWSTARSAGPLRWVRQTNRSAGEWLLSRSSPLAICPPAEEAAPNPKVAGGRPSRASGKRAAIFAWTDSEGVLHIVNEPESVPERYRETAAAMAGAPASEFSGRFSKIGETGRDVEPARTFRKPPSASGGKVVAVIYSAAWCEACREAKRYLASLSVRIDERDVDSDRSALAELKALSGENAAIPVTVIGDAVVAGYDPQRLRAAVDAARRR
ncbi:MAG: glutaredoxin family protein [Myxococcales bacterium]|nr:glutaredoxin family protein [Myxococcales bacterium]